MAGFLKFAWTDDRVEFVKANWGKLTTRQIGARIGTGAGTVVKKAQRLGLPSLKKPKRTEFAAKLAKKVFGPRTHRGRPNAKRVEVEAQIHAIREAAIADQTIKVGDARWVEAVQRCKALRKSIGYAEPRSPVDDCYGFGKDMMAW